ncbi:MAG: DUF1573 domain-containing protein [Phycisphaeraceae bacterium]|nr:DUF1573 domain-containing protein [Phycisphaeraceae bacterium]
MCVTNSSAWAELEWPSRTIQLQAAPADTQATASFTFTNRGEKPVNILEVRSTCGCTTGRQEKMTYAPGETGAITVTFEFGDRSGKQTKHVFVRTDEPKQREYPLALEVDIPVLLEITPAVLVWQSVDGAASKTLTLRPWRPADPQAGPGLRIVKVEASPDVVDLELVPAPSQEASVSDDPTPAQQVEQSGVAEAPTTQPAAASADGPVAFPDQYLLTITPRPAWTPGQMVTITIRTDFPPNQPRVFQVLARRFPP